MKRSESKRGCKLHQNPNEKKVQGVCSSCLRDKLSKLHVDSTNKPIGHLQCSPSSASLSASAQPLSSQSSSNYVSPLRHQNLMDPLVTFKNGLKKSSSVHFSSSSRLIRDGDVRRGWGRKKDGFWSKLFKLTRKETKQAFTRSKTTKEARA